MLGAEEGGASVLAVFAKDKIRGPFRGLRDTQLEEIVACAGQTDGRDGGLCLTDRWWRWPVLDRQMVEMVEMACAGQTDVGNGGMCWTDRWWR